MAIQIWSQKPAKAFGNRHTKERGVGAEMAIKTLFANT